MCLAVPGKIEKKRGNSALVNFQGLKKEISLDLVPWAKVNDWVIVHAGYAIQKLSAKDAQEIMKLTIPKSKNPKIELIEKIKKISAKIGRKVKIMELCGTHSQTAARYGIKRVLPKNIELISGPGCPICVTTQKEIDLCVHLALNKIPIASYGDLLRVPGSQLSLEEAKQRGAKVFEIYSIEEVFNLQKIYPNLIFIGIGFETTAPITARAVKKGITVLSLHKLFFPAMEALLKSKIKIDGFINPGHVSTIIGIKPYKKLKIPQVIAGFEGEDMLIAIYMILNQIFQGKQEVENEYKRSVTEDGNKTAQKEIFEVFKITDAFWRGLGKIPKSGLEIKQKYEKFNARIKYKDILKKMPKNPSKKSACICDKILKGVKKPKDCPLFKKICKPEQPTGPCMVSPEGACNIQYRYNDE